MGSLAEGDLNSSGDLILYKNVLVAKVGPDGSFKWKKIMGVDGASSRRGTRIAVDSSENIFVAFPLSRTTAPVYTADDVAVMKFDKSGAAGWTKRYGGENWDQAEAVAAAPDGSTVAVGYRVHVPQTREFGHTVIWLARIEANGEQSLYKEFGRAGTVNTPDAVAIDGEGNYVVSGTNLGGWTTNRPDIYERQTAD